MAAVIGAVNGIIVAWLGLSPVIVTLATNGLVEGGLLAYEHGMSPLNVPMPITHWVYTKVWGLSSAGILWIVAVHHVGRSFCAVRRPGSGTWQRVATTLQQFSQVSRRV